jgi:hypothetical protein
MVFVMTITVWALALQAVRAFGAAPGLNPTTVNGVVCVLLVGLTALLAWEALRALRRPAAEAA